jgi:hypothetical protein
MTTDAKLILFANHLKGECIRQNVDIFLNLGINIHFFFISNVIWGLIFMSFPFEQLMSMTIFQLLIIVVVII